MSPGCSNAILVIIFQYRIKDSHIFREGAFSGLDSLEWLKLEDNAISALDGGDLFPVSLKVLFHKHHQCWKYILNSQPFSMIIAFADLSERCCEQKLMLLRIYSYSRVRHPQISFFFSGNWDPQQPMALWLQTSWVFKVSLSAEKA